MSQQASTSTVLQHATLSPAHNLTETLTLTLVPRRKKKGVKWSEEVVDNEFAGKKSSKKCCIFHRRRQFGDWSDDDDSDEECQPCSNPGDNSAPQGAAQSAAAAQQ